MCGHWAGIHSADFKSETAGAEGIAKLDTLAVLCHSPPASSSLVVSSVAVIPFSFRGRASLRQQETSREHREKMHFATYSRTREPPMERTAATARNDVVKRTNMRMLRQRKTEIVGEGDGRRRRERKSKVYCTCFSLCLSLCLPFVAHQTDRRCVAACAATMADRKRRARRR